MTPEKCCVDMLAVSIAGLVLLCARWSAAEPQHGGFKVHEHSQAARALAASLVDVALEDTCGVRTMRVVFDADWECRRPRPDAIASTRTVIEFEVEGKRVSLAPWRSVYENKPNGSYFARVVWEKACMSWLGDKPHMADVIFALSVFPRHAPVVAQMILFLVDDLDDLIVKQVVGKKGFGRMQFHPSGGGSLLDTANYRHLRREILRYVISTRDAPADRQHWSIPTDKGEGGRFDLQYSVVVWGCNTAALALPQARLNPPIAISPMALPCCFCARKATGMCRYVAPALATASDPCLHSSGFRARECLRSALPFSSLYKG